MGKGGAGGEDCGGVGGYEGVGRARGRMAGLGALGSMGCVSRRKCFERWRCAGGVETEMYLYTNDFSLLERSVTVVDLDHDSRRY